MMTREQVEQAYDAVSEKHLALRSVDSCRETLKHARERLREAQESVTRCEKWLCEAEAKCTELGVKP